MVSMAIAFSLASSLPFRSYKLGWLKPLSTQLTQQGHGRRSLSLPSHLGSETERGLRSVCFFNAGDKSETEFQEDKESGSELPILRRWEVPWQWQTVSLASLACGLGFVLTGLIEAAAVPYLGIQYDELSLDEKSEIIFVDQGLGVLFGIADNYQPLPEDFFKYDWREPFNLQKGWLLWAGVGLAGALIAIALTGAALSFFSGETPTRETDALVTLLPLIGSSNVSTACLVGTTGVLAPLLEEPVFRGFFMASLTKWVPTPAAIIISAAVFALAHLTPGEFPQLSWRISTAVCFRDCVGYFLCSNSQSSHSHHYPCFLELWSYITSYFSPASRIQYQRIVADNLMPTFCLLFTDLEHVQFHFFVAKYSQIIVKEKKELETVYLVIANKICDELHFML